MGRSNSKECGVFYLGIPSSFLDYYLSNSQLYTVPVAFRKLRQCSCHAGPECPKMCDQAQAGSLSDRPAVRQSAVPTLFDT